MMLKILVLSVLIGAASGQTQACNIGSAFPNGYEAGVAGSGTSACVLGAGNLADSATCNIALKDGYAGSGTTTNVCGSNTAALVPVGGATGATTGCTANYFEAGINAGAADIVCTACPDGKLLAAAAHTGAATTCDDCSTNMGTAGTCLTGCPTNTYQGTVKGTDNADITCVACAAGYLLAAAAPDAAVTACSKCALGSSVNCITGCFAGSFQKEGTAVGSIQCHACADGTTTPAAAVLGAKVTDSGVCVACTNQHADKCTASSTAKCSTLAGYEDHFQCTTANTAKGYKLSTSQTYNSAEPCLTSCTYCATGYFQKTVLSGSTATCEECAAGYTIATAAVGSAATTCTATTSGAAFVTTGLAVVMAMVVAAVAI